MSTAHRTLLFSAALALAACSPAASGSAGAKGAASAPVERHAVSGLAVIPLMVTHGKVRHAFRVEVAASRLEQAKGLMFRTALGPDEGMIFPFDPPRMASFWMRNTVIPLDIIFIGPDRRIVNIAANATPYSEEQRESIAPAAAVLELRGGRAAELRLAPGDKVDW